MTTSIGFRNLIFMCTLLALLHPFLAMAQPIPGVELKVSGSLLYFNYHELNDNGKMLNREEGFIPGVALGLSTTVNQWVFAGDFSYHRGDVAYIGKTNTGIPITTTTRQRISLVSRT